MGSPAVTPAASRQPITLKTAIEGLQFVAALAAETNNTDPRLPGLVKTLKEDVIAALAAIDKGDDQGKVTNPDEE